MSATKKPIKKPIEDPVNIPSSKAILRMVKEDKIPPGWFTREQCQREWKVSQSYAAHLIRVALKNKKVEIRKFLVLTSQRGLFPTQHYRFK